MALLRNSHDTTGIATRAQHAALRTMQAPPWRAMARPSEIELLLVFALAVNVVLVVAATPVLAQSVPASAPVRQEDPAADVVLLAGSVIDPDKAAVPGAEVLAECGAAQVRATSDALGRVALTVPHGRCVLHTVKPGFEPASYEITASAGANAPLVIALRVAGYTERTTVVSAAAIERSLRDAPASVAVVTAADLESRPIRDLSEALAMVEGVTARRSGNFAPAIQLRGLDGAYTLMLIDGKRVNATSAMFRGNDFDTGWVPAAAVERIEVVRGPMSSLYGSDAIGGVVNIITKRVGESWTGGLTASTNVQTNRNAGDAYVGNVYVGGPIVRQRLGVRAHTGVDHRDADGVVNPARPGGAAALPGFPGTDNRFAAADVHWRADARQDLKFHWDGSRRDHGGFVMTRSAGSFAHQGTWGTTTSDVLVYGDAIRNRVGTVTGQLNPNRATSTVAEGRLNVPFLAHIVTVGGQYRREALEDPANLAGLPGTPTFGQDPRISVWQSAGFAEANFGVGSRLRLTLGHRYDHHQNFGGNHSPRVYAISHVTPSFSLKAGVSRAFRAPTLLQNSPRWGSVSCGSATTGCFIIGSTQLEPETSTSGEASAQFDRRDWAGGVTYFRNDLQNMIDISNRTANPALAPTFPNFIGFLPAGPPGNGRPIFRYQNINKVQTQGIEASVRYAPSVALQIRVNYGYLMAENLSGPVALPLVYRPAHTFNTSVTWQPHGRTTLTGMLRANGEQDISVPASGVGVVSRDGYAIVDLSAAYRFDRRFTVRAGMLNVGNQAVARETSQDFNEEGRRVFVSVSLGF